MSNLFVTPAPISERIGATMSHQFISSPEWITNYSFLLTNYSYPTKAL